MACFVMLGVVMMSFLMLSVIVLRVVILNCHFAECCSAKQSTYVVRWYLTLNVLIYKSQNVLRSRKH